MIFVSCSNINEYVRNYQDYLTLNRAIYVSLSMSSSALPVLVHAALPGNLSRQPITASLPGSLARQPPDSVITYMTYIYFHGLLIKTINKLSCPANLPSHPCPASLPGILARHPCPTALPGILARHPCPASLPGILLTQF
jgi:hypothetical protein